MRRSAAPSRVQFESGIDPTKVKRPRFVAPASTKESPKSDNVNLCNTPNNTDVCLKNTTPNILRPLFSNEVQPTHSESDHIKSPLLSDFHNKRAQVSDNSLFHKKPATELVKPNQEKLAVQKKSSYLISCQNKPIEETKRHLLEEKNIALQSNNQNGELSDNSRFLSVVWCKLSKKKHKKWEGDAVLKVTGRTATLLDMESKMIGKGSGYKTSELETLKEDETLVVGGKEILVMAVISKEQFKSGKCFTGASTEKPVSTAHQPVKTASKPFTNPVLKPGNTKVMTSLKLSSVSTVRFDPQAPGALVMPRPTNDCQWRHCKQGDSIVDVVVDPYLSSALREHQREGIVFLYKCVMGFTGLHGTGAILADDMGLGKTLQCIALIWTLLKQGPYGGKPVAKKVLIVTPGSLVKNWYMEFKKWLGTERLNVYAVSGDKKVDGFVKSNLHPVLVISYEMFVRCCDVLNTVNFDLIVCDEGHRLKNTTTKTTSLLASLACVRRIVLTGTPVQNDLQEFFSIVDFCNPGVLGTSAAFKRVYEDPIVSSRQPKASAAERELGEDRAQELSRLTHMFVLRRSQDVNTKYLPEKVELVLFCQASSLQISLYQQLLRGNLIRRCLTGQFNGSPHLVVIGALKQLCNHPGLVYRKAAERELELANSYNSQSEDSMYDNLMDLFPPTFDASTVSVEDSGKMKVLSSILESIWRFSSSEKVVLVSNHTKTLDFLQVFCDIKGYSFLRLDGQTATNQRQDLVNRFNNKYSNQRIFLLSSKAGGVGLNLVGASRLVLYDIDWNPANDLQAMARVWRDGQRKKVHIYRLLTVGTIEEKIYQRQITKQDLSGAVIETGKKNSVNFSLEDLKDLFSLNKSTACETHAMLGCVCEGDPEFSRAPLVEEPVQDDRPCQLGKTKPKLGKNNLTMAELMKWRHWKGSYSYLQPDWLLNEVGPELSFIFWNNSVNAKDESID